MWDWITSTGLRIVAIVLSAWLANKFILAAIRRTIERPLLKDSAHKKEDQYKRLETLMRVFNSSITVLVWAAAGFYILLELGVDLAPLLAGAGIAGLAIAFGAQQTISDYVSGFYIIAENQYRVGDVVDINGVGGKVQRITMRITELRDLDGNVHYIRNGEINMSTNKTMTYSKINMDLGIGYSSDIDKVERVVNTVGEELASDDKWHEVILEAPKFLRITDFGESGIQIKISGKTLPGKHWQVAGEFRRRLKKAFDKEDIEIPFPQRVIHQGKRSSN